MDSLTDIINGRDGDSLVGKDVIANDQGTYNVVASNGQQLDVIDSTGSEMYLHLDRVIQVCDTNDLTD